MTAMRLCDIKECGPKREHGDIEGLKQSIKDVGLINIRVRTKRLPLGDESQGLVQRRERWNPAGCESRKPILLLQKF